ncbi:hypothetical protein RJ639_031901 [Escallonia herrerae]|uniref:Uncharacterized protein n=1 Tax=Escallonia herrerae TaxID=1293975 RepID=A0AA88XFC9_9ASTE|nr:hypothetical protein RJ639_031901 [Escallonia herrerae]
MVPWWSWLMVLVGGGGYGFAVVVEVGNGFARFGNLTNILEAHIQVQSLLVSEYTSEEIQSVINMVSIQDLQAELDNLLQGAC